MALEVANEIKRQIGNKALFMMGAKNFGGTENALSFKIASPIANFVRITLNSLDLYDVEFIKIRGMNVKVVSKAEMVYADSLNQVLANRTGLCLSL